jgi:hypothetical protein
LLVFLSRYFLTESIPDPWYSHKTELAKGSLWVFLLDLFRKARIHVNKTKVRKMYVRPLHFRQ